MVSESYEYSWPNLDTEHKSFLRSRKATLVLAPRELSRERLLQIVKQYLPVGTIVFGISSEPHVAGFDTQPQFRMLDSKIVSVLAAKVSSSVSPQKLYMLRYPQHATDDVIRFVRPRKVVVVRGSYQYAFHRSSTYRLLMKREIPFELISPFTDEAEAHAYEARVSKGWGDIELPRVGNEVEMLALANKVASRSYDYSFQTGLVIAEKEPGGYKPILATYNPVIPYQTYALHFGNAREDNLSNVHDTNHYDTIHAEMHALVELMHRGDTLEGRTMFIELLPCPNCARTLSQTGLRELVYRRDHSGGYAKKLFEQCKITVRTMEDA